MQVAAIKQRLLGALILLLLGFICWPLLFDEYQSKPMDISSRVPPMPDFEEFEVEPYQGPEADRVNLPPEIKKTKEELKPETDLPSSKTLLKQARPAVQEQKKQSRALAQEFKRRPQTAPKAWVIQVGSFSRQSNCKKLVERLNKARFETYWRRSKQQKSLCEVYAGPYLRQADANAAKRKIDKAYKVKSWIKTYRP